LRVRVLETGLATYPDVTVVCGPRELDPADSNTVTNPTLIVEVLSHSTEEYDRGDKFEHYKRVPTLMQYVLVSQALRDVEVWSRREGEWSKIVSSPVDSAQLESIGAQVDVDELYDATAEPAR
jgi:Uma2 family endonuclease